MLQYSTMMIKHNPKTLIEQDMLQRSDEVVRGYLLLAWSHIPIEESVGVLPELSSRKGAGVAVALRLQAGWNGCNSQAKL